MQAIVGMSDQATASSYPGSILPAPISLFIHVMNRVHWFWKYQRLSHDLATSTSNMKRFAAGNLLNWGTPDVFMMRTLVRFSAKFTLIALRVMELGKQKVRTGQALADLEDAIFVRRPLRTKARLSRSYPTPLQQLLGPDSYIWLMKRKDAFVNYVSRIVRCVANLFKQMFLTSMSYMDIIEIVSLDPSVENQAINEFFLNTKRLLDEISENKQHIYAELVRHKGLIQQILSGLGMPCTADQVISAFSTTLTVTERTAGAAEKAWEIAGNMIQTKASKIMLHLFGRTPGMLLPEDPNPVRPTY